MSERPMKGLKHLVNWVIWSVVAVYALLMTSTHLPTCQRWIGTWVANAIGQRLGTSVSIERVDVGFLNRLIVDGLQVKDQKGRPMLEVGRMSVKLDLLPLSEGRVVISSAQLFNARAMVQRKDSLSPTNFQFVLDSLSSKDPASNQGPDVTVNSLIIRRSSVSYNQLDKEQTPGVINPAHLMVSDISAHVILKYLTSDSLSVNVKRLTFSEKSGLNVRRLSLLAEKRPGGARLTNFFLQLPRSSLTMDSIVATCDFDHLKETLHFRADLTDCSITPGDLAFLSPMVRKLKTPIKIRASLTGDAFGAEAEQLKVYSVDGALSATLRGWWRKEEEQTSWYARIAELKAGAECFELLRATADDLPGPVRQLTDVQLTGEGQRHRDGHTTIYGQATTNVGNVKLNAVVNAHQHYSGHVESENIELGRLLDNEELGMVSTLMDFEGDQEAVSVKGGVTQLVFRGHAYHNITLDGSYHIKKGDIAGKLQIGDSQLEASIEGSMTNSQSKAIRIAGNISRINPKALGLSSQWGNASFRGLVNADLTASSLNDLTGTLSLQQFAMRDSDLNYRIEQLQLQCGLDGEERYLKLNGDMGDVELRGHFDWTTLPGSFMNIVGHRLPTLPLLDKKRNATNNVCKGRVRLSDTRWLKHLLGVDMELRKPIVLEAAIDDQTHKAELTGSFPLFAFNDVLYEKGTLSVTSPEDSMKCQMSLVRLSNDGRHRTNFGVTATAANNELNTAMHWDNNRADARVSGMLNTRTSLYQNGNGISEASISILPSFVVMGNAKWEVEPGSIIYNAEKIEVNHLSVVHDQQHIIADGVASASENDLLTLDLNGVEVAYILDLVGFTAVSFAGEVTGRAYITRAFDNPDAWANLNVENFHFEGGHLGTLHAEAKWNQLLKQIDIHAIADDGPDARTLIDGYVSPTHERIDLAIGGRGTSVEFLHTYAGSVMSNIKGKATGDLRLVGPLGEMDLLGQLVVDAQATVTALGTTYTLRQDTVSFVHNDILLQNVVARDMHQNTAVVNGGIHHDHLTAMTFDIKVATDKLLAYDMKDGSDETFYGTVMASGNVDIIGRPGEVTINCDATPLAGTVFTYNTASPDAISDQRFIRWKVRKSDSLAVIPADSLGLAENIRDDNGPKQQEETDNPAPSSTDLRINFLLNTTPDATLRLLMDAKTSDYVTLAGQGVIRATYHDKGAFQMFGTYTVDHGTYGITIQNIIKKNFTFQPGGTIVFGGAPFDAALNLQALYTVNGVSLSDLSIGNTFTNNTVRVNCLMNIGGQAGAPQVDFDLDMPTVNSEEKQMIRSVITSEQEMNQQVLYLLGIGRFYTQGANNASAQQQYAQSELAMQSFLSGTLSTQINEVLAQVLKTSNWNFGANISTGNEGWHNAEYEGIVSGRMLNNRLLINGQFGYRDNATQATPSFIGDFDIRYLLLPNGNIALKVYNQTNDRYFTRSSLNTQGIGFVMKKDFNGLADLFHKRKKKKEKAKEKEGEKQ